jgi:hypothetical protein
MIRVMTIALAAACCLAASGPAVASQVGIHTGKVVSAGDGKIAIVDEVDGDNEEFEVLSDAEITLDGKAVSLEELQPGHYVQVATKLHKGKQVAVVVEARSRT